MKEFYTRSITATAYALVLLVPLFYNEFMFYLIGFICSLILVFEFHCLYLQGRPVIDCC